MWRNVSNSDHTYSQILEFRAELFLQIILFVKKYVIDFKKPELVSAIFLPFSLPSVFLLPLFFCLCFPPPPVLCIRTHALQGEGGSSIRRVEKSSHK